MIFSFKQKSFTLIEMLIVIVIIGILAAALIPRLQSVQNRARDTKRKVDMRNIDNALRIYMSDNGVYPLAGSCAVNTQCYVFSSSGPNWFPQITGIMTSVPQDPIKNTNNTSFFVMTGGYDYLYGSLYKDGKAYLLATRLENIKDPDRCELQDYHWYTSLGGGTIWGCQVDTSCGPLGLTGCLHSCWGGVNCKETYIMSDLGP